MKIKRKEFVCDAFGLDNETQCKHNLFKIFNDKLGFFAECQKCKKYARIKIRFTMPEIDFDVYGGKVKYSKKEPNSQSNEKTEKKK